MTRLFRNVLTVMSGTLASRVLGFIRQVIFNNLFSGSLKDAFNVAYSVPNLFREVLAEGAITNALIPVLKLQQPREAERFARRFGGLLLGVNLALLGLGFLLAPWVVNVLVAPGSPIDRPMAIYLTRLALPFLTFISMGSLFSALLQSEERFFAPSYAPVLFNVGAILLMALWPGNPAALGLSVTVGGLLQAVIQLPYLRGFGLELAWHPAITSALRLILPFTFTTAIRQAATLVMVRILSTYPTAALTGYYNASIIFQMSLGLLAISPALAYYPRLAQQVADHDWERFRDTLRSALERTGVLLGLAAALLVALAPWITGTFFAWSRQFSAGNYAFTSAALAALGYAVLPWGMNTLLLRAHYARTEVVHAVQVTVLVFTVNILGYLLFSPLGMFRLNLVTAFAGLLGTVLYTIRLNLAGVLSARRLLALVLRLAVAAAGSAIVAHQLAAVVGPAGSAFASAPPLAVGSVGGVVTYLLLARLLGLPLIPLRFLYRR